MKVESEEQRGKSKGKEMFGFFLKKKQLAELQSGFKFSNGFRRS